MPKEFFLFFSSKEYNLGAVACHGSKTINVTVNFGTENHQVFFSQDPYKFRKHVQPINVIAVRFFFLHSNLGDACSLVKDTMKLSYVIDRKKIL